MRLLASDQRESHGAFGLRYLVLKYTNSLVPVFLFVAILALYKYTCVLYFDLVRGDRDAQ